MHEIDFRIHCRLVEHSSIVKCYRKRFVTLVMQNLLTSKLIVTNDDLIFVDWTTRSFRRLQPFSCASNAFVSKSSELEPHMGQRIALSYFTRVITVQYSSAHNSCSSKFSLSVSDAQIHYCSLVYLDTFAVNIKVVNIFPIITLRSLLSTRRLTHSKQSQTI